MDRATAGVVALLGGPDLDTGWGLRLQAD